MSVRIKDIAEKTGFSEATVSLAINNSSLVNQNTKKKILKAAKECGYVPNSAARNLARQESSCFGLIVPDIENVFYASLVKHINQAVKALGFSLIIAISDNNAATEKRIVADMIENRVRGVIIVPMDMPNPSPQYFEKLSNFDIPFVFCSDVYDEYKNKAPVVMSDLESGMYELTKTVIENGYQNVVYLTGAEDVPSLKMRQSGFEQAAKDKGVHTRIFRMERVDYDCACRATEELINQDRDIDAFVCVNDMIALGVINTLSSFGISVPEQIGVTGFDNIVFSKVSYPAITTVDQDIAKLAEVSVALLNDETKVEQSLVLTKVELRGSIQNKRR